MTATLKPFADDAAATQIGDLTIENGTDKMAVYGSLDITRDKEGLERARRLLAIVQDAVAVLEGDKNLPEKVAPPEKPDTVDNPFA